MRLKLNYSQLSSARCGGAPLINVTLGPGRLGTQLRFLGAGQNSLVILRMFCPPHFASVPFLKTRLVCFSPYSALMECVCGSSFSTKHDSECFGRGKGDACLVALHQTHYEGCA